jgi:hypothetical protein
MGHEKQISVPAYRMIDKGTILKGSFFADEVFGYFFPEKK